MKKKGKSTHICIEKMVVDFIATYSQDLLTVCRLQLLGFHHLYSTVASEKKTKNWPVLKFQYGETKSSRGPQNLTTSTTSYRIWKQQRAVNFIISSC